MAAKAQSKHYSPVESFRKEKSSLPSLPDRASLTSPSGGPRKSPSGQVPPITHGGYRPNGWSGTGAPPPSRSGGAPLQSSQGSRKPYAPYVPGPLAQRQEEAHRVLTSQQAPRKGVRYAFGNKEEDERNSQQPPPVRVLALDGATGPNAGMLPLLVVAELERRSGVKAAKLFDLIVGTGTGGIGAAALARQGSQAGAAEIAELFAQRSVGVAAAQKKGIEAASSQLEEAVRAVVGDGALRSCSTNVAVVAYDMRKGEPALLRSWDAQTAHIPAATAARAGASSPGVFSAVEIDGAPLSDGSVAGVSPALAAWSEARRMNPTSPNYVVISLGCGPVSSRTSTPTSLDLFLKALANAPVSSTDRSLRVLLGGNYVRVDSEKSLDHATKEEVRAEADKIVAAFAGTLESVAQRLLLKQQ